MTLDQALIDRFNDKNTLIIFGSYPQKGHIHDKNVDALASFTRNRVIGLDPTKNHKIVIITHQGNEPAIEISPNLLVIRIFQKNNPLSFIQIRDILKIFTETKHLLIEYEFSTFGGNQMTMSFIPFLISLRNLGIKITIELHQVLLDLQQLKGHLGYKDNDIRTSVFNQVLIHFYRSLGHSVDHIIVLEEHLKSKLSKLVDPKKIICIPHGVQSFKHQITKSSARKKLNLKQTDFVVLAFGYLTWYKGSDLFVDAALKLTKNNKIKFMLAGGQSHNQKNKPHYQKWYQKIVSKIKSTHNLTHTDFVTEKNISLYYSAADLVVFPYRTFMSSSGPLSICFSHHKPFILSTRLSPYLKSEDFKTSLGHTSAAQHLTFSPTAESLANKIAYLSKHRSLLNHQKSISQRLAKNRAYRLLGTKQREIIFS